MLGGRDLSTSYKKEEVKQCVAMVSNSVSITIVRNRQLNVKVEGPNAIIKDTALRERERVFTCQPSFKYV